MGEWGIRNAMYRAGAFLFLLASLATALAEEQTTILIELETETPTSTLVRNSFFGLLSTSAAFSYEASFSEGESFLRHTLTLDGAYDPRLVEDLERQISSFLYPYSAHTTLTVQGIPFEGERLTFTKVNVSDQSTSVGFTDVAFGAGRFLTLPSTQADSAGIQYLASPDGASWTLHVITGFFSPGPVYFLKDRFMLPATNDIGEPVVLTSGNGLDWEASPVPFYPQTMAYGAGAWVGINGSNGSYIISTDGHSFAGSKVLPVLGGVNRLIFANGLFVAIGGGIYPSGLWTSETGIEWIATEPESLPGRVTAPGAFIAGGNGVFMNYLGGQSPAGGQTLTVDFENGLFFNCAAGIHYSPGITGFIEAEVFPSLGFNRPNSFAYGKGKYVCTGLFTGIHVAEATDPSPGSGSLWEAVLPVNPEGDKLAGVGWINDAAYPYIWHYATGGWMVILDAVSSLDNLFGWDYKNAFWFWANDSWGGWYVNLSDSSWGTNGWARWE